MTARRVDEETLRQMVAYGKTRGEIADLMGVSEFTVWKHVRILGLGGFKMGRRGHNLDEAKFRQLWAGGFTIEGIAEKMSMSSSNVGYHAKRLNLSRRGNGRRKASDMPMDAPVAPQIASQTADSGLVGQLLATKGKWASLADVAARNGLTMTQAQQRFHAARAMG